MNTIFALATPPGRSGIAVIRVSGPMATAAAAALGATGLQPRQAALRRLRAADGVSDQALVLRFKAPHSFTGEDVTEFHLHGGPAVVRAVLAQLGALPDLRIAEPGEFTRRALLNGKLDLSQVEGLGDLLAAETAAQAKQAMRLMEGKLSALVQAWRADLIDALAIIEASIEFSEDDLPGNLLATVERSLDGVAAAFARELADSEVTERLRHGFEIALVGRPNVGKSTLLNAIAGREAALTSDVAGTTRDIIEVRLSLRGLPVTILDMAGLRDGWGPVERLGVKRARARAEAADLRVFLVEQEADAATLGVALQDMDITAIAKGDLSPRPAPPGALRVSGLTGEGVDALLQAIATTLGDQAGSPGLLSHARQRRAISQAATAVTSALVSLERPDPQLELTAAEIQGALTALDFLIGKVDVDNVLDVIFQQFCLGK